MTRSLALVVGLLAVAGSAHAVDPSAAGPATSGEARVDGRPLAVAHAYLFHAPDNWNEKQTNDVAVLTAKPLDTAELKKAATLAEALKQAPERIVVESHPDGKADLAICHPGLDGACYTTTVSLPDEWQHAITANGHLTGHVRILGGHETTVFQKYRIFYDFKFDAAPVRDFTKRR